MLTAVIITKNEEANLTRCLSSIGWVDEVVVVDSGSSDKTICIAKSFGARVIETEWLGFGRTKQLAVDHASNEWVLSIDADEEITETLKCEIQEVLVSASKFGYRIPRTSFYMGKPIHYCGWQSDAPLRLFHKEYGCFNGKIVHEAVEMDTEPGKLREAMNHYTYPTISTHIAKIDTYTTLGAAQLVEKGKKAGLLTACTRGLGKFVKMYFLKRGFLDGKRGFVLSVVSAFGVTLKYLKLWEATTNGRR